jgi:carbon-monoxide dehydrogenase medium subunit
MRSSCLAVQTPRRGFSRGQSLIPALSARTISASLLLDIMRCPGLDEVSQTPGEVTIGAACRQSRIEKSPVVQQSIPLLSEALGWVAMPQVRSRGTVVGCLAQANAGGEVPVVSLALDAEFNILSRGGVRQPDARPGCLCRGKQARGCLRRA